MKSLKVILSIATGGQGNTAPILTVHFLNNLVPTLERNDVLLELSLHLFNVIVIYPDAKRPDLT